MPIAVQVLRAFDNEKRSVVKSEILFFDQMLGRFLPKPVHLMIHEDHLSVVERFF